MSITNVFCRRTKNIIVKLKKNKSFVKVDMRQVAARDLLEAGEGGYQDLRLFQDLNPGACASALKIHVLCDMYSQSISFTSKLVIQSNEYLLWLSYHGWQFLLELSHLNSWLYPTPEGFGNCPNVWNHQARPKRSHISRIRWFHLRSACIESAFSLWERLFLFFFFSLWSSIHMLNSLSISFISLDHLLIGFTGLGVTDLSFIPVALSLTVPSADSFMPVAQGGVTCSLMSFNT